VVVPLCCINDHRHASALSPNLQIHRMMKRMPWWTWALPLFLALVP
jgi:hypothetical protein